MTALLLLLPAKVLGADAIDYPAFRHTRPVMVQASRIVIQNDEKSRTLGRNRWSRIDIAPEDTVEKYLRARFRGTGKGAVLFIKIRRAEILDQGKTDLGNTRRYIDISLDVSTISSEPIHAKRVTEVSVKRSTISDDGFYGNLPVRSGDDVMKELIENLDRRMKDALIHELKIL